MTLAKATNPLKKAKLMPTRMPMIASVFTPSFKTDAIAKQHAITPAAKPHKPNTVKWKAGVEVDSGRPLDKRTISAAYNEK